MRQQYSKSGLTSTQKPKRGKTKRSQKTVDTGDMEFGDMSTGDVDNTETGDSEPALTRVSGPRHHGSLLEGRQGGHQVVVVILLVLLNYSYGNSCRTSVPTFAAWMNFLRIRSSH